MFIKLFVEWKLFYIKLINNFMGKIIYAATPFRMENQRDKICDFIEEKGNFPLHPLLALPYKRYNYERHPKEQIYKVCFGLIDISDEVWIFGLGGGSLKEWAYAKEKNKETLSLVKQFDPSWKIWKNKEKYKTKYHELVEEVLSRST